MGLLAACAAGRPAPPREQAASDLRPASDARPQPEAEADIARALDDLNDAAAKADEERYFAHFAASGVFLGTDATERWGVAAFRAFAHPYFARGKAWTFKATRRAVTVEGAHAWFDEDLDTPNLGPARGSGVLVREGGQWKIAQYNLTITVPNERMKDVRALLERTPAR